MPVRVTAKVVDIDRGWKAFENSLRTMVGNVVVGVVGPQANAPRLPRARSVVAMMRKKPRRAGGRGAKGFGKEPTNIQVAMWNEFGLGVPERSFLRSTWELYSDSYRKFLVDGLAKELFEATKRKRKLTMYTSSTLKKLAGRMEFDVKRRIRERIAPPNAPATIQRKGSDVPLVDTGQLRRAIVGIVRAKGERR